MCRPSKRPDPGHCPKHETIICSPVHQWEYSQSWNGNGEIVRWLGYPHGIPRSGWRCYNCGKFAWDQTDLEFALVHAHARGLVKLPTEKPVPLPIRETNT